jgi:hypothetical protein
VQSHHQLQFVWFNYLHTEQETKSITLLVSPQFFHILVATHDEFLIVTLEFGAAGAGQLVSVVLLTNGDGDFLTSGAGSRYPFTKM